MQEVADFISKVGFPVAVAAFLLWRMNGKLDRLTDSIERLIRAVGRLHGAMHDEEGE